MRLVTDTVVSSKVASNRLAWFGGPATACNASMLASTTSAAAKSDSLRVRFITPPSRRLRLRPYARLLQKRSIGNGTDAQDR